MSMAGGKKDWRAARAVSDAGSCGHRGGSYVFGMDGAGAPGAGEAPLPSAKGSAPVLVRGMF